MENDFIKKCSPNRKLKLGIFKKWIQYPLVWTQFVFREMKIAATGKRRPSHRNFHLFVYDTIAIIIQIWSRLKTSAAVPACHLAISRGLFPAAENSLLSSLILLVHKRPNTIHTIPYHTYVLCVFSENVDFLWVIIHLTPMLLYSHKSRHIEFCKIYTYTLYVLC